MTAVIAHLKRRAEFLRVAASGRRWAAPGVVLQVLPWPGDTSPNGSPESVAPPSVLPESAIPKSAALRVGFTASRKVGIAVKRNRARRRLRAAVDAVLPDHAAPGHDYVLIARAATVTRDYAALVEDLRNALRRLGVYRDAVTEEKPRS